MLKWKCDCLLKKKLNKNNSWKSDKGFTLVELLASIALLSVVILLAGSVHIFGQRQFISQTESASQANDLTYSLSVMSRDLRKADSVLIDNLKNKITIDGVMTYSLEGPELKKNLEVLSNRVSDVVFVMIDDKEEKEIGITVILYSTDNQQNQSNEYQTTIYFRR